jgi:hypothetical protein
MKTRKPRGATGATTHLISLYALDRERAQYLMEHYSAQMQRPIKLSELVRILITEAAEREK